MIHMRLSLSETKKRPQKSVSLSQYLHFLTDINRESTKTLNDGLYPSMSIALWVKNIKQIEHSSNPFPNPCPFPLSERIVTVPANESKCLSKVGSLST